MKNAALGSKRQFLLGVAEIFISQNVSKWLLKRLANQKSDTERSKMFYQIFQISLYCRSPTSIMPHCTTL